MTNGRARGILPDDQARRRYTGWYRRSHNLTLIHFQQHATDFIENALIKNIFDQHYFSVEWTLRITGGNLYFHAANQRDYLATLKDNLNSNGSPVGALQLVWQTIAPVITRDPLIAVVTQTEQSKQYLRIKTWVVRDHVCIQQNLLKPYNWNFINNEHTTSSDRLIITFKLH